MIFFPDTASAVDAKLAWTESDGYNIAGYRLYCRKENQSYDYTNPIWEGSGAEVTVSGLQPETNYYFIVSAFNTSNIESADSNEVLFYKEKTDNESPDADEGASVTLDGAGSYGEESSSGGCFISTASSDKLSISYFIKAAGNFFDHFFKNDSSSESTCEQDLKHFDCTES